MVGSRMKKDFNEVSIKLNTIRSFTGCVICVDFFCIKGHVALDKNLGLGYDTLLLGLIPGDLLSACPHRQIHTILALLDSRAALSNSHPNACVPSREALCTIFSHPPKRNRFILYMHISLDGLINICENGGGGGSMKNYGGLWRILCYSIKCL